MVGPEPPDDRRGHRCRGQRPERDRDPEPERQQRGYPQQGCVQAGRPKNRLLHGDRHRQPGTCHQLAGRAASARRDEGRCDEGPDQRAGGTAKYSVYYNRKN